MSELDAALALFQTRRSGELGRVIVELGRAAVDGFEPPALRKNMEFHRAWQALAKDVQRRTWCLDTLIDRLPKLVDGKEYAFGDKSDALVERLAGFLEIDPDPRIARGMIALLELNAPVTGFMNVLEQIGLVIQRHADDESAAAVAETDDSDHLGSLVFPEPAPLTAEERARWVRKKAAPKHDANALWAAVYAAPGDDEPRTVLADHLQELGDPRGEFIALQLREHRGEATPEMSARAEELLDKHGKAWLGALRPIVYRATMRRGFLASVELAGRWATTKWKQLAADPSFATVEELDAGQATGKVVAQLIAGPVVPRTLRVLSVDDDELWKVIAATPMPRLDTLRCHHWKRKKYDQRFHETVLPFIERTPAITTVGCDLELVAKFGKALKARLVGFECRDDLKAALKLWDQLPKLRRLRCEWSSPIELVRDGKRTFARVHASTFGYGEPPLQKLPKAIDTVEIIGNATFAKKVEAKFGKRFDIIAVPRRGAITGVK